MADAPRDPAHHDPTGLGTMKTFDSEGNQPGDALDPRNSSKNLRGVEANFALKLANNPAKRSKLDEHKVAMLGKKRARQTVLINDEDAKQAGVGTISTPRRQSRGVGEGAAETQNQLVIRDQRQDERMWSERSNSAAPDDRNTESYGDYELASQDWSKKMNAEEPSSDGYEQSVPRHLRQTMDSKQFKGRPVSSQRAVVTGQNTADQRPANKRFLVSKKQASANNTQYHDTSIERLLQEVTSDKFWHNPDEPELQSVPGSFESAEEYIRVFEPLLFEECRAQLYSSYRSLLRLYQGMHIVTVLLQVLLRVPLSGVPPIEILAA